MGLNALDAVGEAVDPIIRLGCTAVKVASTFGWKTMVSV